MIRVRAFWDTSALVPLCLLEPKTKTAYSLLRRHRIVVWWSTPLEMTSAFMRTMRSGEISGAVYAKAQREAEGHANIWDVVQPSVQLAAEARSMLEKHPLRAADALQLAAALAWCEWRPRGNSFLT